MKKFLVVVDMQKDFVDGALGSREAVAIVPAAAEKITFGSVELPELIIREAAGDDFSIELIGLCTDICVVSNALLLKASFPEAAIAVDEKCCAGVTPEKHAAAIETMRSCQIDIL